MSLSFEEIQKKGEGKLPTRTFSFEEINQVEEPTLDEQSAEETGALFPAETGEGPAMAGLKAAGNLPTSAFGFGKNIFEAITNPIQTAKGIGQAVSGGVRTAGEATGVLEEKETESEAVFDAIRDQLKQRYGSLEALQRTATNDPFAFGADILGIVTGGAGTFGKLGTVTKTIDSVSDVAKSTVLRPIQSKLDNAAVSQMEKALQLNPSDVRRIQLPNVANQNPSEWVLSRGFSGSQQKIANDLVEYSRNTKATVDEGLSVIQTAVPASEVQSATQILQVLRETFDNVPGTEVIQSRIQNLAQKDAYTLSELNDIKRLVDSELRIFSRAGDIKAGATSKGLFNLRDDLKTSIEDIAAKNGFDTVKQLNKETQVATEIAKAVNKRLDVSSKNLELGLRDTVIGVGGFAAGDPTFGIATVAAKKAIESAQFRTWLANKIKTSPQKDELLQAVETSNIPLILNFFGASLNEYMEANPSLEESDQTLPPQ